MRLVICSTEFPPGPGGIATHAHQLATHLKRSGWDVLVISAQDFSTSAEVAAFNAAQSFPIAPLVRWGGIAGFAVTRLAALIRVLRQWRPDLLVATGDGAVYLSALASLTCRLPLAVVEHGRVPGRAEMMLKRWALRRAQRIVAVSEYTRKSALQMGAPGSRTCTIHNGADAGFFHPLPAAEARALRARLGLDNRPVLLTVGNVTRRKGQDAVIRALPRVLERVPGVHYVVAGLPTLRPEFESLARKLGVAGHVAFAGCVSRRRLLEYLNCCDLFVMTSRHASNQFEGFGISVVEAALCGKPAVVSANSGLLEAIADGKTGIAVPEGDEARIAAAISRLLENEQERRQMGEAARTRALTHQTWERCAQQYDRLFRDLVMPAVARSVALGTAAEAPEG